MKFNCGPSIEARRAARKQRIIQECREIEEWHPWFAWFPVRVDKEDCRWLETIERRYVSPSPQRTYGLWPSRYWQIHYREIDYRELGAKNEW